MSNQKNEKERIYEIKKLVLLAKLYTNVTQIRAYYRCLAAIRRYIQIFVFEKKN